MRLFIKWGCVLPLQKVGVRTPHPPKITPMETVTYNRAEHKFQMISQYVCRRLLFLREV